MEPVATAHPRVSGENLTWCDQISLPVGSSPRERGKLTGGESAGSTIRLIPA